MKRPKLEGQSECELQRELVEDICPLITCFFENIVIIFFTLDDVFSYNYISHLKNGLYRHTHIQTNLMRS